MRREVYPLLKFSYDSLANDLLQKCFLYCRFFPEDYQIAKSDLVDLWIGEGFLDNELKNKGFDIIGSLVYAGLLEESYGTGLVKMHDVLRDMALWIAYDNEDEKSMVETSVRLLQVPMGRKWEGMKRVSLMENQITNLDEVPSCCSALRTLLLRDNEIEVISDGFFQFMSALTVLDLSRNSWLDHFTMEISQLASLQFLNLSGTQIDNIFNQT